MRNHVPAAPGLRPPRSAGRGVRWGCPAYVSGVIRAPEGLTFRLGKRPPGESLGPTLRSGMQPGAVELRAALMRAWEGDLRAVRQDSFDPGRGREALLFIQRFYGLISDLRQPIQHAWGPGGHVHVVDSPDLGGPGPRVSQSRIRLRNHGEGVAVELFSYADGDSRANHSAGLDREIRVADADPLFLVNERGGRFSPGRAESGPRARGLVLAVRARRRRLLRRERAVAVGRGGVPAGDKGVRGVGLLRERARRAEPAHRVCRQRQRIGHQWRRRRDAAVHRTAAAVRGAPGGPRRIHSAGPGCRGGGPGGRTGCQR